MHLNMKNWSNALMTSNKQSQKLKEKQQGKHIFQFNYFFKRLLLPHELKKGTKKRREKVEGAAALHGYKIKLIVCKLVSAAKVTGSQFAMVQEHVAVGRGAVSCNAHIRNNTLRLPRL